MKRFLSALAVVMLLLPGGMVLAESPDNALLGTVTYPPGAAEEAASLVFSYRLPQFRAGQPQAQAMNEYFASYAKDIVETVIPATMNAVDEQPLPGDPGYTIRLDYRIPSITQDQCSVLLQSQQFLGNTLIEQWVSVVFALDGIYAGQPISLSQAMGLEREGDTLGDDPASELVYGLVWQIIQYDIGSMERAYFPDVTEDEFRLAFSPQDDFYFDADGNFVFFIQAGIIAGEVEGVLQYPFSPAELLSAIGQDEN